MITIKKANKDKREFAHVTLSNGIGAVLVSLGDELADSVDKETSAACMFVKSGGL